MMNISRYIAFLLITSVASLQVISCGPKEEADDEPIVTTSSPPPSDEITQQQIEEMADRSLSEVVMEGGFSFDTQRMVSIDLRFAKNQNHTEISIYAIKDSSMERPGSLLEHGVLYNASRYRGMLSVPTYINYLTVISRGSFSKSVEVTIDKYNRAHYVFEEFLL